MDIEIKYIIGLYLIDEVLDIAQNHLNPLFE